jgi:hypothetical protein
MKTVISWLGTISSILGSFLVAFGYSNLGYPSFIIGSFCWLSIGFANKDKPLIVLNGTFLIANIIGVYRTFYV